MSDILQPYDSINAATQYPIGEERTIAEVARRGNNAILVVDDGGLPTDRIQMKGYFTRPLQAFIDENTDTTIIFVRPNTPDLDESTQLRGAMDCTEVAMEIIKAITQPESNDQVDGELLTQGLREQIAGLKLIGVVADSLSAVSEDDDTVSLDGYPILQNVFRFNKGTLDQIDGSEVIKDYLTRNRIPMALYSTRVWEENIERLRFPKDRGVLQKILMLFASRAVE